MTKHQRRDAPDRASLYDDITNKIIAELEDGRLPWVQPWGTAAAMCAAVGTAKRCAPDANCLARNFPCRDGSHENHSEVYRCRNGLCPSFFPRCMKIFSSVSQLSGSRSTIRGRRATPSENVWISMLETYLPKRYQAAKAHVVDSLGNFSQQIDVVIFDRQYSPFIFTYENETIIPAESVYAVFEAKQTADAGLVAYAQEKVASFRRLHRSSLPIPYAKGVYPAKPLIPKCAACHSLSPIFWKASSAAFLARSIWRARRRPQVLRCVAVTYEQARRPCDPRPPK
jgi:hypothetical protein